MADNTFKSVLLADRVYEKLENDILQGLYSRGQIVTETGLAEELGVSRTPIREALRRLSQDRLITDGTCGKGYEVLGITEEDVRDVLHIRCRVEGLASFYAAQNISEEGLAELEHIVELQAFYTDKGDAAHVKSMDDRFHLIICEQSGHPMLADLLIPLRMRIQKYRRNSIDVPAARSEIVAEHRKIYEAIAAHDAQLAEALTEEHLRNAMARIMGGRKA